MKLFPSDKIEKILYINATGKRGGGRAEFQKLFEPFFLVRLICNWLLLLQRNNAHGKRMAYEKAMT